MHTIIIAPGDNKKYNNGVSQLAYHWQTSFTLLEIAAK